MSDTEISPPTHAVRLEIEQAVERDETQLGTTFRIIRDTGESSPTALAGLGAAANPGAVSNQQTSLRILLDGHITTSVSAARAGIRDIRRLRKNNEFTEHCRQFLDRLSAQLDEVASDPDSDAAETIEILEKGFALEKKSEGRAGIYVYTYPHYHKHPYDAENNLYLMKVGRSVDAESRPTRQAAVTAAPEEPLVLKVYIDASSRDLVQLENMFHRLITTAGHPRSRLNQRREWFATREEFLDEIAAALNLIDVSEA